MELLPDLCDPGKTSLDVGAKVGMYSYRLLKHSNKVIAFEPIPELHRLLGKVFNGKSNFQAVNGGLSSKAGEAILRQPVYRRGYHKYGQATIEPENKLEFENIQAIREIPIPLETLDDYIDEPVGFIKIDVEGHEISVLEGGKKLLKKHKPTILVEIQEILVKDGINRVRKLLEPLGYDGCFIFGKKFNHMNGFCRDDFPDVKNFIFVHKSKNIDLDAIQAKLAS